MNEREVILHCHLFKNAGTTLDWALEHTFDQGFFDHRDDKAMFQNGVVYLEEFLTENSGVQALSSHHMPFSPENKKSYWWLVLLREPVGRVRSVYEFEVKQPVSSLGSKMAKKMDLSEYIGWRMRDDVPAVIKNFYVRYLCNIANPGKSVNELNLENAYQRLSLDNVLFGTVERFDESMVFFEESLKGSFPSIDLSYIRQNVSRSNNTATPLSFLDEITAESRELLLENNQLDKRLHERVSADLENSIRDTQGFSDKLNMFRARCKSLSSGKNG